MTVQEPKVLDHTTAGWESACGLKARHAGAVIIRGPSKIPAQNTLWIVNRAFWDLWWDNRIELPEGPKT